MARETKVTTYNRLIGVTSVFRVEQTLHHQLMKTVKSTVPSKPLCHSDLQGIVDYRSSSAGFVTLDILVGRTFT